MKIIWHQTEHIWHILRLVKICIMMYLSAWAVTLPTLTHWKMYCCLLQRVWSLVQSCSVCVIYHTLFLSTFIQVLICYVKFGPHIYRIYTCLCTTNLSQVPSTLHQTGFFWMFLSAFPWRYFIAIFDLSTPDFEHSLRRIHIPFTDTLVKAVKEVVVKRDVYFLTAITDRDQGLRGVCVCVFVWMKCELLTTMSVRFK